VLTVGSRLPAFHTALGRCLLGFLDDAEIWRRLRTVRIEAYTRATIIDPQALLERVRADRDQGFAIVDEELESGLRSIAVPVTGRDGEVLGAVDISTHAQRITRGELRETFLPALTAAAGQIAQVG
jgi:IclR family pca regulon transcriptional regulator